MNEGVVTPARVAIRHRLPLIGAGIAYMLRDHPSVELLDAGADVADSATIIVADDRTALTIAQSRPKGTRAPHLLVVTGNDREEDIRTALQAGIEGYLLYDFTADELKAAVAALLRRECYFARQVVDRIADHVTYEALTPRELDVLSLLASGFNDKLIARDLGIAVATVKVHAKSVYGKLHANSRLHAVAVARSRGMTLSARVAPVASGRREWSGSASAP